MIKNIRYRIKNGCGIALGLTAALLSGCIENDIPYPYQVGQITGIEVEGMSGNPEISNTSRTVTLTVDDLVDIQQLRITRLKATHDASIYPDSLKCLNAEAFPEKGFASLDSIPAMADTRINFASPVNFLLKTYQDYSWTVAVKQVFNRSVELSGQVGAAVFDEKNKQVVVYVSEKQSLKDITVRSMQLGSSIAVTTPDPALVKDFSRPVTFEVTAFARTEKWVVNVLYTSESQTEANVFPRSKQILVSGGMESGATVEVEYKEKSGSEWNKLESSAVVINGTTYTATIGELEPSTVYLCRATINGKASGDKEVKTATAELLTNGSFDAWSQDAVKPKLWYPWAASGSSFWDTGNKGATLVGGDSNSMPSDETSSGSGSAARLESKWIILKFAAGNIFAGSYLNTEGTDGVLSFGRPFSSFPSKLRIHYKYQPKAINRVNDKYGYTHLKGRMDSCFIYMALTDWDQPLEVRTQISNQQLFNKNDKNVIAYTELISATASDSYQEIDLKLDYRYTNRTPKYLVLVATSSKYGDYFAGGEGSTLWIDNFELIYE